MSTSPAAPGAPELVAESAALVSLPDVYVRLRTTIDTPGSSMDAVANVIRHDPAVTARVLQLTNSAFFGRASRVDTVERAVRVLGTRQLHDIVLATVTAEAFRGIDPSLVNMDLFWVNSVYCALICHALGSRCRLGTTEQLFVDGLLHDVGHLLMYQRLPEECQAALMQADSRHVPVYRVERELLGFDYAQVGGMLMESWRLPPALVEAVRHHPEARLAPAHRVEAAIVHVGSRIAHTGWPFDSAASPEEFALDEDALALTGLTPESVEIAALEAAQEVDEVVTALFGGDVQVTH